MGSGFSKKKKQAKQFQQQLASMQENMAKTEAVGIAGNGLVSITINGEQAIVKVKIKPECVDPEDVEGLEDLIISAHQDATKKLQASMGQGLPSGFPGLF